MVYVCQLSLEFKPYAELDLTLLEEETVSAGSCAERGNESGKYGAAPKWTGTGCSSSATETVDLIVHACDLRAVKDIEAFSEHFDFRILFNRETTGDTQIDVPDRRLMEKVVRQVGKTQRTIRAVNTAVLAEAEDTAGAETVSGGRVARPGEHTYDRGNSPAIEDRSGSLIIFEASEVRVVNNARDELVSPVKGRQSSLALLVEWIERSREAGCESPSGGQTDLVAPPPGSK